MSSLSSLSQSGQEIALLAIEGHVTWTLDTIESSIAKDINAVNPNFDLDTHVDVYDREIRDIEAETQKTVKSLESMLKDLADATEELASTQGSGMSVHRQTIISTHQSQTEFITQAVVEMNFCDEARNELMEESQLLRQNWAGRKSDYWSDPDVTDITKKIETVSKAKARHEHDLEQFFDHHTLGASVSDYAKTEKHRLTLAPGLGKDDSAGSKQIQIFDMYLQGRGNEYWSIIPDITRIGHDIDPTECRTWCPPRTGSIAEPLQSYRKDQSNALAKRIMAMVGQDKSIRTKLLKPQKFGRDKDRADATTYKADQNDGVGLYYVMVNLYRDISQSHKRTLEAAINAASTKFRSGSPTAPLQDLQSQVQEALDLKVRIKWDQSAIPLMGMLTRRNPLFTEVTKKYSENPPDDPEDSAVELDDLCTDVQLMIERLDRDGETWDRSSGSARKAEPTDDDPASAASKKIERLQAETNRLKNQMAKMSYGNNTPVKGKPTTPKFHDGTCQVVGCSHNIKGYTKDRGWRLCASCLLDSTTNKKTLTLKDKSEWLPSRSFSQAMACLSHGEEEGLEPFIEKLTDGQKADISTKLEIYHNTGRLKGRAAKAARVRFAKSSDAESDGEGSEPSQSDAGEDSEDGESRNLFKALAAQRKETQSKYSSDKKKGQGKRAQSLKGKGSRKKPRTEPEKESPKVGKGKGKKAKAKSTHSRKK